MDINKIGDRILSLRKAKNVSQAQVAAAINIKVKTYSSIERGRTLGRVDTLTMLAIYFNVSLDYLILGSTDVDGEIISLLFRLDDEKKDKVKYVLLALMKVL